MKTVFICSPYAGDIESNVQYARLATADSIRRNEAPFTPHLLYTQVLDDKDERNRLLGIKLGIHYLLFADLLAVYQDRGISPGMAKEIKVAESCGMKIEYRNLSVG